MVQGVWLLLDHPFGNLPPAMDPPEVIQFTRIGLKTTMFWNVYPRIILNESVTAQTVKGFETKLCI